jgi:serine/threonine-protein kinase
MNCEDALKIADKVVFDKTGEHLSPPQEVIIRGTWKDQTFDEIAVKNRKTYSGTYLKGEGNKLWKLLSEVLGEPVGKKNFKSVIERRFQSTILSGLLGQTICERYKIIELLGQGEYGKTFLAEDERLPNNPRRVIKRLRSESGETTGKFHREAAVLSQLGDHPQIPTLFDSFEEEGYFYLVQQYIEGHALSQELIEGQPWSEPQVIVLLREILEILEFVHRRKVIHRNINPQNLIRRDTDGKLVLSNFGAVKRINTRQGRTFTGSSAYIPPEQAMGFPELCSDIYAVGIIGIQALTGLHPDQLEVDRLDIIWHNQAQVSPELANVLDEMVCSDDHQRYPSAEEALQAVRGLRAFR